MATSEYPIGGVGATPTLEDVLKIATGEIIKDAWECRTQISCIMYHQCPFTAVRFPPLSFLRLL